MLKFIGARMALQQRKSEATDTKPSATKVTAIHKVVFQKSRCVVTATLERKGRTWRITQPVSFDTAFNYLIDLCGSKMIAFFKSNKGDGKENVEGVSTIPTDEELAEMEGKTTP